MIIVTGGAGFIGSNLVRGLNRRGLTDVLVVDDLSRGEKHLGLNALEFRDYLDYRDFLAQLDRFADAPVEAVFHQGACSDTMERDGRYMLEVNYEYSKRLLEFCLGRCPFLYASSASVYGNGESGFREDPACEWPLNVYAFSKFLFDRHVRLVLPEARTQVVGGCATSTCTGPRRTTRGAWPRWSTSSTTRSARTGASRSSRAARASGATSCTWTTRST